MWHASDLQHTYAGLGLIFSLITHLKDGRSHVDEWRHSSIDFEEDSEKPSFRLKKFFNKVLSITLHTCILMTFWPAFLTASIISHIRR